MTLGVDPGASDRFFQEIYESSDQGIALVRWNRSAGHFDLVRANSRFMELCGCAEEEVSGVSLSDWEAAHGLSLSGVLLPLLEGERTVEEEMEIPGNRWVHVTGTLFSKGDFGLFLRDITESVRLRGELSRSRSLFRGLVEDSGVLFCEFDAEGILSCANEAYCEFFGCTEDELTGKDFYRFIPEEYRQSVREGIGRLSAEAPFQVTEHQVIGAGGVIRWHRWTDRVFFKEDGSVSGYCSMGFDVTEKRESEEVRKEQSRYLEALFEQAPIAICFSRDRRVHRANPAFYNFFGLKPENVLGRKAGEVLSKPGFSRVEGGAIVESIYRGEKIIRDVVRYRGDGSPVDIRIFGIPYMTEAGIEGHFSFFQDLSDARRLEKETLRNRFVVEQSPVVIFEAALGFGATCRFISENVSQFGYKAADVMSGKVSLDMRTHPEDREHLRREIAVADRNGLEYREFTFRLLTADGKYRWVNERHRVLPGTAGRPESLIGVLIDQTELIEAQRHLQESHERLIHHAQEMKEAWEGTIQLLAGVVEMRDPYTRGHQYRVADLCRAIGEELGFEEEPLRELVQAAYVHDIGKMEIPSDYLNRPGPLMPEEMDFIRDHPITGYKLLSGISGPAFLAEIVHQHHERLDGSGYPRGLNGEEILLPSRVLAVADVVEAMLSHRPYRSAHALDDVMEEISREAGRLYDAEIVACCRILFLEKGYCLPPVEDFQ